MTTYGPRESDATFNFRIALDNYQPTRDHRTGIMRHYAADIDGTRPETFTFVALQLKDAHQSIYLLDDGATVRPFYVAGWKVTDDSTTILHLHPMPANPDGRTRPDNGQVIDYTSWQLGPSRAYHVKVARNPILAP